MLEVLDAVRRVSGGEFEVTVAPRRPGDPASFVADSSLLKSRLGWRPVHDDLDRICADALRWEKALSRRNAL